MVFIKLIKWIDSIENKPYFIQIKLCGDSLLLLQNKYLHIVSTQKLIDYFISYRKQYSGQYSLTTALKSDCRFSLTVPPTDVSLINMPLRKQELDISTEHLQIMRHGKKMIMELGRKDITTNQQETVMSDIVVMQHSLSLLFYILSNNKMTDILKITIDQLILSYEIDIKNNIVYILNEQNQLIIGNIKLGTNKGIYQQEKIISLNHLDQHFFKISSNLLHGRTVVAKIIDKEVQLHNRYDKLATTVDQNKEKYQNIEFIEADVAQLRNMQIYQLDNKQWTFVHKEYQNFIVYGKYLFEMLNTLDITYLTLSQNTYQKCNYLEEDNEQQKQYLVSYNILCIAAKDSVNNYIELFQMFQSNQRQCTMYTFIIISLLPLIKIVDMKYQLDFIQFIGAYDLIFKDIRGNVGIIQLNVNDIGNVEL